MTSKLKYVYLAGPMSKGFLPDHIRSAIAAGDRVIDAGGVPYLPQMSIMWEIASPKAYEHWMEQDFAWVERVDCLIRLPGESPGADREVAHAKQHGKPVFLGVEAYLAAAMADKKTVSIIVDGTPHDVNKDKVTYAEIVTLAYPDYPQHPEITYSVTYKKGPNSNHEGVLAPGGSVEVKDGMQFRVVRTGQS